MVGCWRRARAARAIHFPAGAADVLRCSTGTGALTSRSTLWPVDTDKNMRQLSAEHCSSKTEQAYLMRNALLLPGDVRRPAAGVCLASLQVSHAQHHAPQCDAGATVMVDVHRCAEHGLERLERAEPGSAAAHVRLEACKVRDEANAHTQSHTHTHTHTHAHTHRHTHSLSYSPPLPHTTHLSALATPETKSPSCR
jgi:hypothetical protein